MKYSVSTTLLGAPKLFFFLYFLPISLLKQTKKRLNKKRKKKKNKSSNKVSQGPCNILCCRVLCACLCALCESDPCSARPCPLSFFFSPPREKGKVCLFALAHSPGISFQGTGHRARSQTGYRKPRPGLSYLSPAFGTSKASTQSSCGLRSTNFFYFYFFSFSFFCFYFFFFTFSFFSLHFISYSPAASNLG